MMISFIVVLVDALIHSPSDSSFSDVIIHTSYSYLHLNLIQFTLECLACRFLEVLLTWFTNLLEPIQFSVVSSGSMSPTLERGDLIVIDTNFECLHVDDIVTFPLDGQSFVKRIKGLGVSVDILSISSSSHQLTFTHIKIYNMSLVGSS